MCGAFHVGEAPGLRALPDVCRRKGGRHAGAPLGRQASLGAAIAGCGGRSRGASDGGRRGRARGCRSRRFEEELQAAGEQQRRGLTFKDQQSPEAVVFAEPADHSASKGLRHEERCGGTSPNSTALALLGAAAP